MGEPWASSRHGAWMGLIGELEQHGFVHSDLFDVVISTYVARAWPGEPLWILAIGPPSCGKTTAVMTTQHCDDVMVVSSLTPASLITQWGGEQSDRSIMARIDKKLLVIKDFGTILTLGWEAVNQILAIMREAFDGHVSKEFANLRREYEVHFGCIAVSTPVADGHSQLGQQLGERFLKFRPEPIHLRDRRKEVDNQVCPLVKEYLENLDIPESPPYPNGSYLSDAAEIVAHLRTVPLHDSRSREISEIPQFEQPHRLERQLERLWSALYVATGSEDTARRLSLKAALDSIPPRRLGIYSMVYREPDITTPEVIQQNQLGPMVVRRILRDMAATGLLEYQTDGFPKTLRWKVPGDLASFIEETFGHI